MSEWCRGDGEGEGEGEGERRLRGREGRGPCGAEETREQGKGKGEEEEPERRVVDKLSQEEKEWVKEGRKAEEGKRERPHRRQEGREGTGDEGGVKGEGRGPKVGEEGWVGGVGFPADDVNVGDGVF